MSRSNRKYLNQCCHFRNSNSSYYLPGPRFLPYTVGDPIYSDSWAVPRNLKWFLEPRISPWMSLTWLVAYASCRGICHRRMLRSYRTPVVRLHRQQKYATGMAFEIPLELMRGSRNHSGSLSAAQEPGSIGAPTVQSKHRAPSRERGGVWKLWSPPRGERRLRQSPS